MAIVERTITARFTARAASWFKRAWATVVEIASALFSFEEGEYAVSKRDKIVEFVFKRARYYVLDALLTLGSLGVVVVMKEYGFSFLWTFIAVWAYDFLVAAGFVVKYHVSGEDLSLGKDYRRAVDAAAKRSKLLWLTGMLLANVQAVFWTGPEQIVAYYRKELGTFARMYLALVPLSAVQAVFWAVAYGAGYELWVSYF